MPSTRADAPALILCAQIAALALTRRLGRAGVGVGLWDLGATGGAGAGAAMHSRFARWRFRGSGEEEAAWAEQLIEAAGAMPRAPVLIATSDDTLLLLSHQRARLAPHFRFLLPAAATLEMLLDKRRLHEQAAQCGVAVPRSIRLESEADLDPAAAALGFPCLLKSAYSHLAASAEAAAPAAKVRIESREQLRRAFGALAACDDRLMLQEFLPGGAAAVGLYNAYFDAASEPVAVFTGRKLRQYPAAFGTACASEACPMPGLAEPLTAFLRQLHYVGPVDIGLKWDVRAKVYKLLDVNPRLGQNYRTFVGDDRGGTDLGWLTYAEPAGLPLPAARPLRARRRCWRIEDDDARACCDLYRSGAWSASAWLGEALRFRCRRHESAYGWWRDPAPLVWRLERLRHRQGRADGRTREQQLRAEFNLWAAQGRGQTMERQHQRLAEQVLKRIRLQAGDRVLDLGCGSGWASGLTAARVGSEGWAVGLDISEGMLREAPQHPRARFVCASAERIPFPDAFFTHVFSIESFYYLPDPGATLRELRRVLAPGGQLLMLLCVYRGNPHAGQKQRSIRVPMQVHTPAHWRGLLVESQWADVHVEEMRPSPDSAQTDSHAWVCVASARNQSSRTAHPALP